jgi:hypothetical protein
MRLKEYKDAHGNRVSTSSSSGSSSASSGSFKKRLDKLIKYYGQHLPKAVASVNVTLLTNDTLAFTEYYDDRESTVIKYEIYIGPATEAWRLKVDAKPGTKEDIAGQGWVELLKTLRAFITIPVVSTPEYKDLLVEWVDKTGKKVSAPSTSSQPAITSFDNTYRYQSLLAQIKADDIATYFVNKLDDTTLDITLDTAKKNNLNIKIVYNSSSNDYSLTVGGSKTVNECDYEEDILELL